MDEATIWPNGCNKTVPKALQFLSEHGEVPGGGEQDFNSEHLYQLCKEISEAIENVKTLVHHAKVAAHVSTCGMCDKIKHLPWRDDDHGYICVGCLVKLKDESITAAHTNSDTTAADFACWLINHHEGEKILEEDLQVCIHEFLSSVIKCCDCKLPIAGGYETLIDGTRRCLVCAERI